MAALGTVYKLDSVADELKDERLKLAFAEGHDADIPSNMGVFDASDEKEAQRNVASASDDESSNEARDPNIVDWDQPEDKDPANPLYWKSSFKWANIAVVSLITLITPLASSMFAPGVPQVMADFHSDSKMLATFVVSVYLLGFALGPVIIAPLCEMYGRIPLYASCNILFVVFSIACAVAKSLNQLIAFRFLMGCAGVAPLTIGAGTIADIMPLEKRGKAMSIYSIGPLVGPVLGPVGGGYMIQAIGWRWVYWLLAMLSGLATVLTFVVMRESYAPVILERKAAKLRKETGNPNLRSKLDRGITHAELLKVSFIRPMKLLVFSPIVAPLTVYVSFTYGIIYFLFTTYTFVYTGKYHFNFGEVGLTYIPIGIGMLFGIWYLGRYSDRNIVRKRKAGLKVKAEDRIAPKLTVPGALAFPIGIFLYGWTVQYSIHWIVPMIAQVLIGYGMISIFTTIQSYLVDVFTVYAASAIAANTIVRSIFGGLLPLSGLKMYDALGYGWGNSLLAFVALAMVSVPLFFYRYGERIRGMPRFQLKL